MFASSCPDAKDALPPQGKRSDTTTESQRIIAAARKTIVYPLELAFCLFTLTEEVGSYLQSTMTWFGLASSSFSSVAQRNARRMASSPVNLSIRRSSTANVWVDKNTRVICQGFTGKQVGVVADCGVELSLFFHKT